MADPAGNEAKITACFALFDDLWPCDDGPGHIVYADYNVRDSDLDWCIQQIDNGETFSDDHETTDHPVYAATRAVLVYLRAIPEPDRLAWAADPYARRYG